MKRLACGPYKALRICSRSSQSAENMHPDVIGLQMLKNPSGVGLARVLAAQLRALVVLFVPAGQSGWQVGIDQDLHLQHLAGSRPQTLRDVKNCIACLCSQSQQWAAIRRTLTRTVEISERVSIHEPLRVQTGLQYCRQYLTG